MKELLLHLLFIIIIILFVSLIIGFIVFEIVIWTKYGNTPTGEIPAWILWFMFNYIIV